MPNIKYKAADGTWKDILYPIGAYYISNDSTSPANIFGGTWTQITDGRFMRPAVDTSLGGSNSHYHWTAIGWGNNESYAYVNAHKDILYGRVENMSGGDIALHNHWTSGLTRQSGTSAATAIPSYRGCFVWYRTA